jgi:ACT domain-containing protein
MKGIITVLGKDQMGIIAAVCAYLSESGINILDVSQTIVQGYFNMMMIVDLADAPEFYAVQDRLAEIGGNFGVIIKLQREDIFNCMHIV